MPCEQSVTVVESVTQTIAQAIDRGLTVTETAVEPIDVESDASQIVVVEKDTTLQTVDEETRIIDIVGGVQGAQGAQGAQGPVGPQGDVGAAGSQGAVGPQGTVGVQGAAGVQGSRGAQGDVGPQGVQGAAGPQGTAGSQGARGAQGDDGSSGPQGVTGAQGASGAQGAVGPQGPLGPQGDVGSQGATGSQGAVGSQGAAGVQGATGADGPQGADGADGVQGATGVQGAAGSQGAVGAQGAVGPQGAVGAVGGTGPQGATGANGVQGATGAQGAVGTAGTPGAQGATGPQGAVGAQGGAGPQGATGTQGAIGPTGTQGTQGSQGPTGPEFPGVLGKVVCVEAYVNHDVTTGSLPVIDGYQTVEGDRTFLNNQTNQVENGIWTIHASSAWTRPDWFANGMTFQSGQLVFCSDDGQTQISNALLEFDNASATTNYEPFTVGVDPINCDSVRSDIGLPPAGFPNLQQGPFLSAMFGSTNAASLLGAGYPLYAAAILGQAGLDFAGDEGNRLVNLPDPIDNTEPVTLGYFNAHGGTQGPQGAQGSAGPQGATGAQGAQGATGSAATVPNVGMNFVYNVTRTMTDPSSGKFRVNNATFASVTAIAISTTDNDGNSIGAYLALWGAGATIALRVAAAPTEFQIYKVTAAANNTTWYQFTVTPVLAGAGAFSNGDTVDFQPDITGAGPQGAQGAAGSAGATGTQGPQGAQGAQGAAGVASVTGTGYVHATSAVIDGAAKTAQNTAIDVGSFAVAGSAFTKPVAANFTASSGVISATDLTNRMQVNTALASNTQCALTSTTNLPATPYTIDLAFSAAFTQISGAAIASGAGIFLSDGTKYIGHALIAFTSGVETFTFTLTTLTATATNIATTFPIAGNQVYLRITDDGTHRAYWISSNGLDYSKVFQENTNTFLTPTKCGIMCRAASASPPIKLAVYNFVVTGSALGDAS